MSHIPHFRYLPILKAQRDWGLYLRDCGYTEIGPGSPYPPQPHPETHQFDWTRGRTLDEYQLVYLARGRGVFEAKGVRLRAVGAGDVFVLFPGVWHRYAPDPKTGWDEYWLGFQGAWADRLMRAPFFARRSPVIRVGEDEELRQRFVSLVDAVERSPAGRPFSDAGHTLAILGLVQERVQKVGAGRRMSAAVREAQNRILRRAGETLDFAVLARSLGLSYTSFRRQFRTQTGVAPARFQRDIRLNRARELLAATELSISEIAQQIGVDTVFYFSRMFKAKTGLSPKAYRAQVRAAEQPPPARSR
jgi:AraC-like DNA-binding protein